MEQFDLGAIIPATSSDDDILTALTAEITSTLAYDNIDSGRLVCKSADACTTMYVLKELLLRIKRTKKTCYLSLPKKYMSLLPEQSIATLARDGLSFRVSVDTDIASMLPFISAAVKKLIADLPTDFECCSHYMACSDNKKCVNENIDTALACGYNKIIKSGTIYYGANRTSQK